MVANGEEFSGLCERLSLKIPNEHTVVHKSECLFSTDDEHSPDGIYINLSTFESYGKDMLRYDRTYESSIYLHVKKTFVPVPLEQEDDASTDGETIFKEKKSYDELVEYKLFAPSIGFLPLDKADGLLAQIANAVICHTGFEFKTDELLWSESVQESKYARSLVQVENPVQISHSDLKCNRCGATTNLWLNLSDGYIGCGRKYYDEGGCADGSEGAAILHYRETGSVFHLVAKIGTITTKGADIYSYASDEDNLVSDPLLDKHLAHFGIKLQLLEKTEKTTMELELEKNQKYDWSDIVPSESMYTHGKGLIGIENLGNSCYLSSVIQVLASIPELSDFFVNNFNHIASTIPPNKAYDDVVLQFAKTCVALTTDRCLLQFWEILKDYKEKCFELGIPYIEPPCLSCSIKPRMLKYALGRHNSTFNGNEQQDAEEFLSFFVDLLVNLEGQVNERCKDTNPLDLKSLFFFHTRQTILCQGLKKINHTDNETHILSLPLVPNFDDSSHDPTFPLTLQTCLELWQNDQDIDYISESDRKRHHAVLRNSLITQPRYLILKLERFYLKKDWTPGKILNPFIIPETDIRFGLYNENIYNGLDYAVEYTNGKAPSSDSTVVKDEPIVEDLVAMGFPKHLARRAIETTNSTDINVCMDWIMNNGDCENAASDYSVHANDSVQEMNPMVGTLVEMGFPVNRVRDAVKLFGDDISSAVGWLSDESIVVDVDPPQNAVVTTNTPLVEVDKEHGTYEVIAFITHIGNNTNSGHYLCHIKKGQSWYAFNDSKISECTTVPLDSGYIYFLKRSS